MSYKLKILSFTGGSVQGVGLSAIGISILKSGYVPDVIIGESVSAIFAIPLAMRKFDVIKEAMFNFNQKTIFGKFPPLNKKGKFLSLKGVFRFLSGKNSLGKQDALVPFIKQYLTKEMFIEYYNGDFADVIIATANYNTSSLQYWNLKEIDDYNVVIKLILASCNIAVLINPIEINGDYHYDGGMISAQSGTRYLKENKKNISEWRSVWNRPELLQFMIETQNHKWKPKNILEVGKRTVELLYNTTSIDSETDEMYICVKENIQYKTYHLDTETKGLYDTNKDNLLADWENGKKIGNEA